MKKESYLSQPQPLEVYPVFSGTDIIIRKNIKEVEKEEDQGEEVRKYKAWECEEVQYHHKTPVTKEEIKNKLEYWIAIAEGKKEIEAIDDQAKKDNEPTVAERLDALESGLTELAEVIANG